MFVLSYYESSAEPEIFFTCSINTNECIVCECMFFSVCVCVFVFPGVCVCVCSDE